MKQLTLLLSIIVLVTGFGCQSGPRAKEITKPTTPKQRPASATAAKAKFTEAKQAETTGNFSLAESKFRESLDLLPDILVRKDFARFLEARGRRSEALDEYVKVVNNEGGFSATIRSVEFLGKVADLASELSDPRASGLYDEVLAVARPIGPAFPAISVPAGASLQQRRAAARVAAAIPKFFGQKQQARTLLLSTLEDDPTSPVTHYYLADLAFRMRDNATARAHAALSRMYAGDRTDVLAALERLDRNIRE